MPTTEADVRKALEDLVHANIVSIFNGKYSETTCLADTDVSVSFPEPVYDSATDYFINLIEATDVDGIDIRDAIEIKNITANGFTLKSPRNTTVKWQTTRRTPKINFHT